MEAVEGAPVRVVRQNVLRRDLVANSQLLADAYITRVIFLGKGPDCGMGIGMTNAGPAKNSGKSIALFDREFAFDHWVRWIRRRFIASLETAAVDVSGPLAADGFPRDRGARAKVDSDEVEAASKAESRALIELPSI